MPLPAPGGDYDKEARGRVLIVGGEAALPGALVLSGIAALRAGAGKLQLATVQSIATAIGVAVPESAAIGLREENGTIHPSAAKVLRENVERTDALLVGPGTKPGPNNQRFVRSLLDIPTPASVVLDAAALEVLRDSPEILHRFSGKAVLTPHIAEMSMATGMDEREIESAAPQVALDAAVAWSAVVALKGSTTFIASPAGELFRYESGDVGLATSGSGDTLAGIVAGLLARGAEPVTAAVWAVYLHGAAGNVLARRIGRIGYLARELLDEIPVLMGSA
jgi:ADP-dependent NAD(P)H-hydrate dehydratase